MTPKVLDNSEGQITLEAANSSVFKACDINSQESVLIPGQIPDWNTLQIQACYHLSLHLGDDPRNYTGKAVITYTNMAQDSLDDLVFRLYPNSDRIYGGNLHVTSVEISEKPIQPEVFLHDNTGLRVNLDDPIEPGESVVIEFDFEGQLTDGFQDAPGTYGLYNYSQEEDVATYINWYPILATRDDGDWQAEPVVGIGDAVVSEVGLYLVEISAPKNIQVVTSGSLVDQENQNENVIYRFASGPVRDFPVIASPNFTLVQDEIDGITIRHWGIPGGESRWEEALESSLHSLEIFNDSFGSYPYRELDIVVVPLQLASGVEYPGLFLMRDELYYENQERSFLLTTVIAHETAHQWWYGLVGNNVIENPWQDEALTSYSSLLYLDQYQPQVYRGTVDFFTQTREDVDKNLSKSGIGQPVTAFTEQPENYSPVVYSKGAVFFLELRKIIGDQPFFSALQNYFSRNLYKIASPDNLLDEFENSCRCELDDFYGEWGLQ